MNKVNPHQEECLNILQEECAEVIQAASKIKRFGILSKKDPNDLNNIQALEMELGDVLALIDLCLESGIGITRDGLQLAKEAKRQRLAKWMHTKNDKSI